MSTWNIIVALSNVAAYGSAADIEEGQRIMSLVRGCGARVGTPKEVLTVLLADQREPSVAARTKMIVDAANGVETVPNANDLVSITI